MADRALSSGNYRVAAALGRAANALDEADRFAEEASAGSPQLHIWTSCKRTCATWTGASVSCCTAAAAASESRPPSCA